MQLEGLFGGVIDMEATVRGLVEKEIDDLISPEFLKVEIELFKSRFPHKSIEDCLFGFIVGAAFMRFMNITKYSEKKALELWEIIDRRTLEIKGKIKLALGK